MIGLAVRAVEVGARAVPLPTTTAKSRNIRA
jgi:hypothetical protein